MGQQEAGEQPAAGTGKATSRKGDARFVHPHPPVEGLKAQSGGEAERRRAEVAPHTSPNRAPQRLVPNFGALGSSAETLQGELSILRDSPLLLLLLLSPFDATEAEAEATRLVTGSRIEDRAGRVAASTWNAHVYPSTMSGIGSGCGARHLQKCELSNLQETYRGYSKSPMWSAVKRAAPILGHRLPGCDVIFVVGFTRTAQEWER